MAESLVSCFLTYGVVIATEAQFFACSVGCVCGFVDDVIFVHSRQRRLYNVYAK